MGLLVMEDIILLAIVVIVVMVLATVVVDIQVIMHIVLHLSIIHTAIQLQVMDLLITLIMGREQEARVILELLHVAVLSLII